MKSKTYSKELKLWDNVKLSNCLIIYIMLNRNIFEKKNIHNN